MKSKKNRIIITVSVIALIVAIVGISYAYFSAQITGSESGTTLTTSAGTLNVVFNGGSNITASNVYPQDDPVATKTFTVTGSNTTSLTMPYTLTLVMDTNTLSTGALTYTLTSTNTSSNGIVVPSISTQTSITTGSSTITLGSGYFANGTSSVHTYVLNIYFPETSSNQNADQGKSFTAHIGIASSVVGSPDGWNESTSGTLLYALKSANSVTAPLTTPGQYLSSSKEAELASTIDDYGVSYYFRGNVQNNYVVFANMCWRIVRVTGSGSIKLVLYNYNPNSVSNPCDTTQDDTSNAFARYTGTTYTSTFNNSKLDNAYVGFMYGTLSVVETTTDINQTMSSTDSYYYGSSYYYDTSTNTFSLSGNTTSGIWSSIYNDVISTYPYTCLSTSSTGTCNSLQKIDKYVDDTTSHISSNYTGKTTSYAQAQANDNKSTILTNLETWYSTYLSSYSSYLADTIWCNDKSTVVTVARSFYSYSFRSNKVVFFASEKYGYGTYATHYSSTSRIYSPSLICPKDDNGGTLSKFTVNDTVNGNGDLSYAIGLLTSDEVTFAGGSYSDQLSLLIEQSYLFKNASSGYWWTLSPLLYYKLDQTLYFTMTVSNTNSPTNTTTLAVRPAVSLKSTTTVTGTGTSSDPYVVQ